MVSSVSDPHRCWICGGASRPFRPSTIRHRVDAACVRITDSNYGETAALSKCRDCGFVFADPLPHPDVLDLYREMDDQPYQNTAFTRRTQMRQLLSEIRRARPSARSLLDVGAGTGLMVAEARAAGFRAEGVEPSRWCVETAAAVNHVDLFCGTLSEWRTQSHAYDVVALVDVIEHTDKPLQLLREAASMLAPDGAVLVVTPDIGSMTARLMGQRWWHHRVAHVCYFDRASMRRALTGAGLTLEVDTTAAWRFPASYIAERLVRYVPIFPIAGTLKALARSARMQRWEIPVNTRDSRAFIATTGGR
jgi:2-polyprenyl-3-methyl-5-hydroxy-6-metoxy-1,4-benzoquinol methylase